MSEAAAAAIERLREKLIDLSASNRLLNFRHPAGVSGSQSVLRFVGKCPDQIFTRVQDQKSFTVQAVPAPTERELRDFYREPGRIPGLESDSERGRARPDAARWAKYLGWDVDYELPVEADESDGDDRRENGRIRTLLYPEQLDTRLRRLRSNARLAIEESGSNMLFLVLGFLEWVDKSVQKPDENRRSYYAPLILVPTSVDTATSARGVRSFTISWTGEDIQPNLSLKRKLAIDLGIDLPEFAEDDSPDSYFDRVRYAIAPQSSWRIRRFATLTLFTNLGKLLLYLDLDPAKWPESGKPADHPIVRSLVGDAVGERSTEDPVAADPRAIAKAVDLDLCLVDRADESQARALLQALNGENLVIQGPPGTGKSQTITNLIAAALDRGKTVLFVAEKLAALEVVRRRLREVGLGDFCLELHSHKTRKKAFFEDLSTRLSKASRGSPTDFENALTALGARRAELDDYATVIAQPAGQTGYTIADLLFEAGRVRADHPELARRVDDNGLIERVGARGDTLAIDHYSSRDAVRTLSQAAQAVRDLTLFGGPPRCPWRGVGAQGLGINQRAALQRLAEWQDKSRLAAQAISDLNAKTSLTLSSRLSTFAELQRLAECELDLPVLFALIAELRSVFGELSDSLGLSLTVTLHGMFQAGRLLDLVISAPRNALHLAYEGLDLLEAEAALNRLDEALQRRAELLANLEGLIERPDAGDLDERLLRGAGKLLKDASLFARLGKDWREARRLARMISVLGASKKARDQGDALLLLAERVAIDFELENNIEVRRVCGVHFRGAATDVTGLKRAMHWRRSVHTEFGHRTEREIREVLLRARPSDVTEIGQRLSTPLTKLMADAGHIFTGQKIQPQTDLWVAAASFLASGILADVLASQQTEQDVTNLMTLIRLAASAGKEWKEAQQRAMEALSVDPRVWFRSADDWEAEEAAQRASEALNAPAALIPWLTYVRARSGVRQPCAAPLLDALEGDVIVPDDVEEAWHIACLNDAARKLHTSKPILLRFGGLQLNDIRKEYARLDGSVMEMRRRAVSARLLLRRPPDGVQSPRTKEMTELALLARCIAMEKRHPAIRDVVARAGNSLQALKPCFMMGPLSVAQYLSPGALAFDLVIMDEASQIRPEDAIGAVARGGQLVVVGDDRQLPPTSFFDRLGPEGDPLEDSQGDGRFVGQDDESVLALANSSFRGEQGLLRWHYRSRHPELIAFSNYQFYDDKLLIFPAPQESDHRLGLTRIFVENGTAADGVNDAEARRVAEAAVDHLRSQPSQSLMVVAMNIRQKERIEEHIARLEAANGGLGQLLDESEAEARIEPFVVKNLENVQGDERDVVMISMTYGPRQAGGRIEQYFGPINQDKGHRRLNVLFTRAKERMVVFTSMRSGDIQAGPESSPGLHALQSFLRFAETKQLPSGARLTGKSPESPFEEAVARELERGGYSVEPQLGVGHYRIDIAVRNPDAPQQFLLGVECDGVMYHSTLSARDRDRLRQEVLENLGWEIERIWSVDWFQDPARELKRILERLDELRGPQHTEEAAVSEPPEEMGRVAEETPFELRPEPGPNNPRQLKIAFTKKSAPDPRPTEALPREEVRAALIALREKIENESPDADPSRCLLRQAMLEELLRRRPMDAGEWRAKIPLHLRQGTDGEQFKRYREDLFEILAAASAAPDNRRQSAGRRLDVQAH